MPIWGTDHKFALKEPFEIKLERCRDEYYLSGDLWGKACSLRPLSAPYIIVNKHLFFPPFFSKAHDKTIVNAAGGKMILAEAFQGGSVRVHIQRRESSQAILLFQKAKALSVFYWTAAQRKHVNLTPVQACKSAHNKPRSEWFAIYCTESSDCNMAT